MSKQPEPKKKITRAVWENAQPHEDGKTTRIIWDGRLTGFGLRIRPSGAKAFVYVYRANGKPKWATIKATSADDAFDQATEMANQYHRGKDPVAEREEAQREADRKNNAATVGYMLDLFVAEHAKSELAEKTADEYERAADKILKPEIGKIKLGALTMEDVHALFDKLSKRPRQHRSKKPSPNAKPLPPAKAQAEGAMRMLRAALNWSRSKKKTALYGNALPPPLDFKELGLKGTKRRTRLFTENEVARLLAATDKMEADKRLMPSMALAVRLIFALGSRAGEVCRLKWSYIDREAGLIIWEKTKTGQLEKPITPEVERLLKAAPRFFGSPWVCPATDPELPLRVDVLGSAFKRVMKEAEVAAGYGISSHTIRHWFSTKTYTDADLPMAVGMAVVGHKSVATAMRYTHVSREVLAEAARSAAARRERTVKEAAKKGKVVPIRGGKK
ncbi:tyrosine-type recombinase/integrase [Rhizobium sp. RCC_161_2]|uniref:tyrosine-type recombinase/integrase n=1 Tax=Rhizobium sp. RCC_161_2 TaxID=3239219 RepID=UPI0035237C99